MASLGAIPELQSELGLLRAILARSRRQHGACTYFKELQQVAWCSAVDCELGLRSSRLTAIWHAGAAIPEPAPDPLQRQCTWQEAQSWSQQQQVRQTLGCGRSQQASWLTWTCCSAQLTSTQTLGCLQLGRAALLACQQAAAQLSAVLAQQFFVQWCTALFAVMARLQVRVVAL